MSPARHIEGIGTVTLRRRRGMRRFSIRVTASDGVLVSVPWYASFDSALAAVERHRDWVLRELRRVRELEAEQLAASGNGCVTRAHKLQVEPSDTQNILVGIRAGVIIVRHPRTMPAESAPVRHAIRSGILEAYRIEAHAHLPERIRALAIRHGFTFRRLFIKNLRSRWGSCSAVNNINLSLQLMRLPDELVDYVILHELAHTCVKNHGPEFWRLLDRVTGDAKGLDLKLRKQKVWV